MEVIDTQPYHGEIRKLLIEVLCADPCGQGEEWRCRLYVAGDLAEAFPGHMLLGPKCLIRQSYEWSRHARGKRSPMLVDVTGLRFYDMPNRMYRDVIRLTGRRGVAVLVVRPAAHVAAMYGSWAVNRGAELTPAMRAYWAMIIYIVNGGRCGR